MNNLQLKESSISDMNSLPKNIAIYTRVSTEKQDSNNSKANQLESIKQYITIKDGVMFPMKYILILNLLQ